MRKFKSVFVLGLILSSMLLTLSFGYQLEVKGAEQAFFEDDFEI